jgi:hypothetical protein
VPTFQIIRGDAGTARRGAEIAVKLSQENGLTLFAALGALQSAWVSARLDGHETGATRWRRSPTKETNCSLWSALPQSLQMKRDFRKLKSQCSGLVPLVGLSRSLAPQQRGRLL